MSLILAGLMPLCAQKTVVRGFVFDSLTGEPLPFVNIAYKHSTIGTITDLNGAFYLETYNPTDSLVASSLGYRLLSQPVLKSRTQKIDFVLSQESLHIEEVLVTPGVNPAFRILDSINAHRKHNNPNKFEAYQYKAYNKLRLDLNNIDDDFKNQKLMRQFQFVFDYMDSSEVFGKNYLPILISESVSKFYYQKSPAVEKEVIEAFKISGIENNTVSQFSGKMYQRLNVYDNFLTLFEPGFVSPIANFGKMYYKYYLEDSASIEGHWCYKISFKPKRKKERTFYGYFWVADTNWALKKVQLRVSSDVNINFMNDLIAVNEYKQINDSTWFLSREELYIDFNISDKTYGFFGHKYADYEDVKIDAAIPEDVKKMRTNTYADEELIVKDEAYWDTNRMSNLNDQEADIYVMVDSVKEVPMFKTVYGLAEMLFDYYYVMGPVEIGPYYTFYSFNPIEGSRLKFGGRTSKEFSKKVRLGGHLAYGFKDERWKYGATFEYMFDRNPRIKLGLSQYHDMRQLGKSQNALLDDNILSTILRRRPNYKLTMVNQYNAYLEREWFQGFSSTLKFTHQVVFPTEYVPFVIPNDNGEATSLPSLISSEFTLSTHFAYQEKFLLGQFERKSLGSIYPVLDVDFTYGPKGMLDSHYEYFKLKAQLYDKLEINPFGVFKYWVTAGKAFGEVPYPLLELHQGNETYAYDVLAFNMMNYYEFVSDSYISFFAEQHFQGFFLNRIPLIRWLELREVITAKVLFGELSQENRDVMEFPEGLTWLDKPYLEAGIGVENILKLFRVEATWRLSYLDHKDVQLFGLRAKMQLTF